MIVALDCLWGLLLLVGLGVFLAGKAPWYKAALVLAPFCAHLVARSIVLGAARPREGQTT